MAEKVVNTRIQLKYDTYENWTTNNLVLKAGEMAITVVPAETGAVQQEPCVLMKVGDGTSAYNDLQFVSGRAADIYSWAKAASKPSYTASEIEGLDDYISGQIEDTDTQYQLVMDESNDHLLKLQSRPKTGGTCTDVVSVTLPDDSYNDTALTGRVSALETLVGDTAVATQIANAISALDLVNTYETKGAAAQALTDAKAYADEKDATISASVEDLTADVEANTAAIATLNGTGAGSVSKQVADAVAQIVSDAPEAYDTLKEISDWITSHASSAAEMNSDIQALETAMDTKVDKVSGKQLSTEDYTTAEKEKLAGIAAGAQANVIETIQVNGAAQTPSGKTVNISVPTGALASKSEVAESDLAAALASKINGKVDNSALAAIAKTGNINDLVQTSGDVLVLNCGTSSTVL